MEDASIHTMEDHDALCFFPLFFFVPLCTFFGIISSSQSDDPYVYTPFASTPTFYAP